MHAKMRLDRARQSWSKGLEARFGGKHRRASRAPSAVPSIGGEESDDGTTAQGKPARNAPASWISFRDVGSPRQILRASVECEPLWPTATQIANALIVFESRVSRDRETRTFLSRKSLADLDVRT